VLAGAGWSVADQRPGRHLKQVTGGDQGGHLNGRARRRPRGIDDGVAGCLYCGQVRGIENEESQLHHIAEAGPGRQATAQVVEYLPRLRRRIPGPASSPPSSCAIWPLTTTSRPGR
jgi:hypothetical protein